MKNIGNDYYYNNTMRNYFLALFFLLNATSLFAQRHEIGAFLGGANLIADVGSESYINPFPNRQEGGKLGVPVVVGAIYRFNFNPYMGFRLGFYHSQVNNNDQNSNQLYKRRRNAFYKNNITEGSLLFEYNFLPINDENNGHSPFIFAGIGGFLSSEKEVYFRETAIYDAAGNVVEPSGIDERKKRVGNISFPIGVGYKIKFNYNWVIAAEVGFRYTNSDKLDYSEYTFNKNLFDQDGNLRPDADINTYNDYRKKHIGNISNTDWYVFTGLSLTYAFGRPPCYCD